MPRPSSRLMVAALVVVALVVAVGAAVANGVVWPNRWFARGYDVRGVDVSAYQGSIDWDVLSGADIDFAYVKATEGSGHVDERFTANWQAAARTDLLVGAYHFLSFESPGETQAENFISTVPATTGTLPPVVDLELYGKFMTAPAPADQVHAVLDPLLNALTEHYGTAPLLYVTAESYDLYIKGHYDENPLWVRSVIRPLSLPDGRAWTMWQYSNRDRIPGYDGPERYIDMNAFRGSMADLRTLLVGAGDAPVRVAGDEGAH